MINQALEFLISKFINYTPIHSASSSGFSECVQFLLSTGKANINEITTVYLYINI